MMKKITRIAALLAATALLLAGFPACGDDDDGDDDPTLTKIEVNTDAVKRTYTVGDKFDTTGITVKATYSDGSKPDVTADATVVAKIGDTKDPTLTKEDSEVTITATYGEMDSDPVTIPITVKDKSDDPINDDGTGDGNDKEDSGNDDKEDDGNDSENSGNGEDDGSGSGNGEGDKQEEAKGTTYAWNFAAAGLKDTLSYSPSTEEATKDKPQLDAEGTYESTPAGLTLVLPKGAAFNKVDPAMSATKATDIEASTGAIEPHESADITVKVKGPFTAVMLCGANADSNKTNRYAYIKVNGEEVAAPGKANTTLLAKGEKLSYEYTGTDEVTVAFGVSKDYVRIYDIKITTENGDGTGKSAGAVISKAEFVATTDDSTANDVDTLGLEGTKTESSAPEVATAEIKDGKVIITTVSVGSATIKVMNDDGNTATIKVTVTGTGKITEKSITKYQAPAAPGEVTVTYFENADKNYSAAGTSTDTSIVEAKDITIAWGSAATSQFTQSNLGIYTTNSVKGYGIQSDKITLTKNATDSKADFVDADSEIVTVKVTLTPVKNFTVQKISGQFVNGKSGNTVLYVNEADTGVNAGKTLELADYKPTDMKGTIGTDLEIVFAIKANNSGVKGVSAANFQWTQVMNNIKIVVAAEE